jgi:transposase
MNLPLGTLPPYPLSALPGRAVLTPEELDRLFAELDSSRQTIALRDQTIALRDQTLALRDAALHAAELKIQALTLELAHHKRIRFGQKSEVLAAAGQRDLFDEDGIADQAAIEEELARLAKENRPAAPRQPRIRAGRQPLPPHLPRIVHVHEPDSCRCGRCGGADLVKVGEDVTEQLDVQPAKFTVHRHVYPQYACRPCETIVAAPAAPAVIDGGMAATGLLVWVLIGKFLDHLPLYRLAQIAARQGVPLALSTLADWVGRLGVALEPLADRLAEFRRLGNGFIVAQRFDGRTGIVGQQKDVARPTRLARANPLCRDRPPAHRQQPGGERHPPDCRGQEELAVRRVGARGPAGGGHPEPAGDGQAQRPRPRRLAQRHPGQAPHLAQQPHRRTAAAEMGSGSGLKRKKASPW